jgi:predicted nucleic acid-binding protein
VSAGKTFFDSNILVYAQGGQDIAKQRRAQELFQQYAASGMAAVSTQVVQEFYNVCRRLGMDRQELFAAVDTLLNQRLLVVNGPDEIRAAIRLEERYQIPFWDALMVAAAEAAGAEVLFTEDLNDGQQYGSVVARNPFRASGT